ncbi:MAG: PP2C family protein-serine/threonine phosphatase [Planctomycetota bacterium]
MIRPTTQPQLSVPRQPEGLTPAQRTPEFVGRLLAAAEAMKSELENLREQADARRYHLEQVDRELRLAAKLQGDFLPAAMPLVDGMTFHSFHRGVGHVSGDMFGVDRLDEHHVGIHLVDAVGHGMPAALLAMFLGHAIQPKVIQEHGYELLPPGDVLKALNATLCNKGLSHGFFATALYAKANAATGQVDFARAGHPLPIHMAGDDVRYLGGDGALLGVIADEEFTPESIQLQPGDKLVFITDGAECLFADDRYGDQDAWLAAMTQRRDLSGTELIAEVARQCEATRPDDDVTVVVVERC